MKPKALTKIMRMRHRNMSDCIRISFAVVFQTHLQRGEEEHKRKGTNTTIRVNMLS
jgi:hypothetical protein